MLHFARPRHLFIGPFLAVAFVGCAPDFSELSRGQSAVDGVGAASAGMNDTSSGVSGGGDAGDDSSNAGAPSTGGAPLALGGAPSIGGAPNIGGAPDIGGAPPSPGGAPSIGGTSGASDGEAGTGDGGAAVAGNPSLNQGGGGGGDGGSSGSSTTPSSPVASASTEELGSGNLAANAVDGSSVTKWCASDGSAPQWWQIDLQVMTAFTGVSIEFESPEAYAYQLQVSSDGQHFSVVLDRSNNGNATQLQSETVVAHGRYVRVYFPTLPPADPWPHWACMREFNLLGSQADPTDHDAGPANGGSAGVGGG